MSVTNLGDLSQSYSMRQRNVSLRQDIDRLTAELASGQVADVRKVLAGNHSYLTDIERRTTILEGYGIATTEASIFASNMQQALGNMQEFGGDLSLSLLAAGSGVTGKVSSNTAAEARNMLASMIGAVNTNAAGRYLFSGTATDRPPLPDLETVLNALRPVIAGAADPDAAMLAATAWFDDPAGFDTVLYNGSADGLQPFALSQSDDVELDIRAIDPSVKEILKLTAVSALANDAVLGFDAETQSDLFDKAGKALLVAQDDMVSLRANIGFVESRIDSIATRNAAELTSMGFAKAGLLEVDPFTAATQLEEAQFQLQSLYSVTVRMSQLSLVNFL